MGFTSIMVGVVLVRELLLNFLGNELSVGVILASWLLFEGLGSWTLGRLSTRIANPIPYYIGLQIAVASLLPLAVVEARTVRNLVGVIPGQGVGLPTIVYLSFVILAPLALCDGGQFTLGCRIFSSGSGVSSIGHVYVLEALGSVIGGVGATYLFVPWVPSMTSVFMVGLFNLTSGLLLLLHFRPDFTRIQVCKSMGDNYVHRAFNLRLPYHLPAVRSDREKNSGGTLEGIRACRIKELRLR